MDTSGGEEYKASSTYDQLATLADRNVVQVEFLEQNVLNVQNEKERLAKEIVLLQKKRQHSAKALEDAQMAYSDLNRIASQLKQQVSMKKEESSLASLANSALTEKVQEIKDVIRDKRLAFIETYEKRKDENCNFSIQLSSMLDTKLVDKVISIHASEDISEEKHPEVVQELSAILDMYESMCRQTYEIVGE